MGLGCIIMYRPAGLRGNLFSRLMPFNGIQDSLRERGVRLTRQRRILLDLIDHSGQHLDAESLFKLAKEKDPKLNRVTVYRTLKLLQAAGLAQELVLQGQTRFEREYKREHHDHFICKSCGEIFEFSSPEIERIQDEIAADIGFVIDGHRHQIFGFCRDCAAAAAKARPAARG